MSTAQPGHEEAKRVAMQFSIPAGDLRVHHLSAGHINDTFVAAVHHSGGTHWYTVQRINHHVFPDVPELMRNILRVTTHLRDRLTRIPGSDPGREALTVVPTREGGLFLKNGDGEYWRCYVFIDGARTYDVTQNCRQAYEAARAFGRFQKLLADLPAPALHETIPDFHDAALRFAALEKAIQADVCGRVKDCGPEIEFALRLKPITGTVVRALRCGDIPKRVTHNDTKINNVLLDDKTGLAVCVIDLDVVMPGSVLYDFGDQVRSTAGRFQENERNLDKVHVDLNYFGSLVEGYLQEAGAFLTEAEVGLLPFSGLLMTFTIGIRFLTDYLAGDVYFKTDWAGENLDRCRVQFALARSIQANEPAMKAKVSNHWRLCRRGR